MIMVALSILCHVVGDPMGHEPKPSRDAVRGMLCIKRNLLKPGRRTRPQFERRDMGYSVHTIVLTMLSPNYYNFDGVASLRLRP